MAQGIDWPGWVTGFGTIAVALTAVWAAVRPELRRQRQRPMLKLLYGDTEPFERPVFDGSEIIEYRLRLRVTNVGKSTAKNVRPTIEQWWSFSNTNAGQHWGKNDIDPLPAAWVFAGIEYGGRALDIPAGGEALFNLVRWEPARQRLSLVVDAVPHGLPFRTDGGPYGEQRLSVSVVSENAEGVHDILSFTVREGTPVDPSTGTRRPPMHDVHWAPEPAPNEVIDLGYIALIQNQPG